MLVTKSIRNQIVEVCLLKKLNLLSSVKSKIKYPPPRSNNLKNTATFLYKQNLIFFLDFFYYTFYDATLVRTLSVTQVRVLSLGLQF